jgi:hypothetical protein
MYLPEESAPDGLSQSLFFSSQKESAGASSDREVSVRLIALLQGTRSIRRWENGQCAAGRFPNQHKGFS